MLVSGSEILNKANKEGYGVGAFNFVNFEMLSAIFEAAHEASSPIFVQASEGAVKYLGMDMVVGMTRILSARYPHIPVALHLDHGSSYDSCDKAIRGGFTSWRRAKSNFGSPLNLNAPWLVPIAGAK